MDDRFNTAAGWVLFSGIVALGASIVSGMYYEADRPHHVEQGGYPIEDLDASAEGAEEVVDIGAIWEEVSIADGEQQATARCGTCHTFNQGGPNGQGPNLYAVLGTQIGKHAPGFNYSSAMAEHGGTWTIEAMDAWLTAPRQFIPGTTMSFAGLKDDPSRIAIIKYLNSLGSNLTPPAPLPEEGAESEDAVDGAGEGPGPVEGEEAGEAEAAGAMSADQPVPGDGSTNPVE